jgi:hypothetical protein
VGSRVAVSSGVGWVNTIGGMEVPSRVLITMVGPVLILVAVVVATSSSGACVGVDFSRVGVCMAVFTCVVPLFEAQPVKTINKTKQRTVCAVIGFN